MTDEVREHALQILRRIQEAGRKWIEELRSNPESRQILRSLCPDIPEESVAKLLDPRCPTDSAEIQHLVLIFASHILSGNPQN